MELLILALIIGAVNVFFSNKKKKEESSSPERPGSRNQDTGSRSQGGFKRMEDYAKEIYGEFQTQMNPEADKKEQVKEVAREVVERKTNRRPDRQATPVAAKEIGGRLSAHQQPAQQVKKKQSEENSSPFPLTQNEAQKAIILAEVFMPPKSKRR